MILKELTDFLLEDEIALRKDKPSTKKTTRLSVRKRLETLLDPDAPFFEMGIWAAHGMYPEWGECPAAGVVTGIGKVQNRSCMIIANDASVKAGAFFPQSVKKVLRAQRVAFECKLPILYLVDSSGVFLPLQDEIFPDEDDFGRIFRNNAVLSAEGIPQFAAIMGNCIAGGGYLPVLCDQLLMTEGSGLYLAGPALVKAAIGQVTDSEELGGAKMHAELSGTVDYIAKDDNDCLERLRKLVGMLPTDLEVYLLSDAPKTPPEEIYKIFKDEGYDTHELLNTILDEDSWIEYKSDYGKTLLTGFAKMGGAPVGVVANQRIPVKNGKGEIEIGGVLYAESADKAARFVMECNQMQIPILFFQDVMGFMVGKEAESSGIIRSGAKLVSAISNSIVPKITCIVGNSFGAGHYALCGKAYDPNFILAWPNAKYAVMGAEQAHDTLNTVQTKAAEKRGETVSKESLHAIYDSYIKKTNIRYGAARGWVDAIIAPHNTRSVLIQLLSLVKRAPKTKQTFHTGVIQT
jgi:3-methylcrotonyl-CoA carboxylase beta subunit